MQGDFDTQHLIQILHSFQNLPKLVRMSQERQSNVNGKGTESHNKLSNSDASVLLPLEVIDRSIGSSIRILLTNNKEFTGTLIGFDDFVNVVLENAVELELNGTRGKSMKKMLLNGAQIAMLCPSS